VRKSFLNDFSSDLGQIELFFGSLPSIYSFLFYEKGAVKSRVAALLPSRTEPPSSAHFGHWGSTAAAAAAEQVRVAQAQAAAAVAPASNGVAASRGGHALASAAPRALQAAGLHAAERHWKDSLAISVGCIPGALLRRHGCLL